MTEEETSEDLSEYERQNPHLLNQDAPRAQQLGLPDFLAMPHLGHAVGGTTAGVVVTSTGAFVTSVSIDDWPAVKGMTTLHCFGHDFTTQVGVIDAGEHTFACIDAVAPRVAKS